MYSSILLNLHAYLANPHFKHMQSPSASHRGQYLMCVVRANPHPIRRKGTGPWHDAQTDPALRWRSQRCERREASTKACDLASQISLLQGWLNLEPNWRRGDLNHNHLKSWDPHGSNPTSMGHVFSISIGGFLSDGWLRGSHASPASPKSCTAAEGGDVWVFSMHAVRINGL